MSPRRTRVEDAPLLAWGEALRREKAHQDRIRRRLVLAATAIGGGILLFTAALPQTPRLVWNASASAPIGLYIVAPNASVEPGDMVIARTPLRYRRLAAERGYLPFNVPLVKRVAAFGGDEVCALHDQISINGRLAAVRRKADSRGRPMPMWSGCIRLNGNQIFLLTDSPTSFDGRYFGVIERADLVGKARLLWRR